MFVGREKELALLEESWNSKKSTISVVYGRRRIGKSSLVKKFIQEKKAFCFEGIEGETTLKQIGYFTEMLKKQTEDPLLDSILFKSWDAVFTYITNQIVKKERKRIVLFFDEIQWISAKRKTFISIMKYYFDNFWKDSDVMLILCGSIASFMVDKVIKSKALYGRIDLEILLKGLSPPEAALFFNAKKSDAEILKYLLVLGTVPKYLEFVNQKLSFNKNMNKMFFSNHGKMATEMEKIFYSQFKESTSYQNIVKLLKTGLLMSGEIATKSKIPTGGGLKRYLDNLENAEIIKSYIPYGKKVGSKIKKYTLSDEYLKFYFKYIEPHREIIKESTSEKLFETLTRKSFDVWLGFQFEKFCLKNSFYLAEIMGFKDEVILASPYFEKGDSSFQIDLLFVRADNIITVCEIKFYNKKVSTKVVSDLKRKLNLLKIPRGYSVETALITVHGIDSSLEESDYFDHVISLNEILKRT